MFNLSRACELSWGAIPLPLFCEKTAKIMEGPQRKTVSRPPAASDGPSTALVASTRFAAAFPIAGEASEGVVTFNKPFIQGPASCERDTDDPSS